MAGGNIKVVVRVRPFNSRELDRNAKCIVQMKDTQTVLIPPHEAEERHRSSTAKGGKAGDGQKVFAFDKSYWSFNRADPHFAGQENLFKDLGVPLLDNAFQGYNNCIFAYGQTGSGKSYSMMGYGEEAGVIPKICEDMFRRITRIQEDKNLSVTVEVSYLEIYNERVRDLLNPTTKGNLKVREHPSTGPYVEDLAKLVVRSFKEIENLMDEGNKARTVAATNMNETSSRSHAVFTLTLTQKRHDVETSLDTEKVAKISLVDLAGSERATSTGATGARLKEGAEINRSLSTLGRVIAALADLSMGKKKTASMVPYRDSVLTWLLKDSLGGNSLTAMIAAISPADINYEETLSTLRYADSAKRIKNHAVVNEDPNARMIRELKEELAQLRAKLGGGGSVPGSTEEQYAPDTPLDKQMVSITQPDGTIKRVSKAEIAEQLSQSEKLYKDLNETWEEKLAKTEQIHKEREAALEELGISIEKGFVGLSTPKKTPHLVNLSDDPLLTECLVYNIKPGKTTVGNVEEGDITSEIRLNGSKILRDHCTFENVENIVTVFPKEGAAVMVNGLRVDKPTRLRSGNRIILGDFHIFRFNHPQEARAERAEQSLLRHSVTMSQLESASPRPGHERSYSKAGSEIDADSRPESPFPKSGGRDSDWSFARREAASAILGSDHKISNLTDEELDNLYNDVQKALAVRQGRPESRMLGIDGDDSESVSSYPVRDKYLSNCTIDNFSLDTALTFPNTPQIDGEDGNQSENEKLQTVREELQAQLDRQKEDYLEKLKQAELSAQTVEELRVEKQRMEDELRASKEDLQQQLLQQKAAFEARLEQMLKPPKPRWDGKKFTELPEEEKACATYVVERWRHLRHMKLAEVVLKYAALLKEAQIMSQLMDKSVKFQFTVVQDGQDMCSSYDLVMNGISGDEDEALETTIKPCVAIRVIDYQHSIIRLWSLDKLEHRVQAMRQLYQYIDRPDYIQHFRLENPFIDGFLPRFSLIGDAHVPLTAVFEARVEDYDVQIISPYTQGTIGTVRLSLEPSTAEAPDSMIKFNVVMHDMVGFAEHEGTDVHAQLVLPGISEDGGATTTQMIQGFDEDPIRFESVHSMSLPQGSPYKATLQVAIFARVTSVHLDKLLSWDEMREVGSLETLQVKHPRMPETEYSVPEQHDVFVKIQMLEMSETGEYHPVEVEQDSPQDAGTYQLRQGLQRRIVVHFSHTSSESLGWEKACSMRVGCVRLVDPWGKVPDLTITPDIPLRLVQEPSIREEAGSTSHLTIVGQWDSSLHDSLLLDRPTAERYSVQVTVSCDVASSRTNSPLTFSFDQTLQIRPRSWLRPQSLFKQLWKKTRLVHSTVAIFSVILKPPTNKGNGELWRINSQHQYVRGEEDLIGWSPRGVSLVLDYIASRRRRQRITEVEAAQVSLASYHLLSPHPHGAASDLPEYNSHQTALLQKCLSLWTTPLPNLVPKTLTSTSPPSSPPGRSMSPVPQKKPKLTPVVNVEHKNPSVLKSGFLLTPLPYSLTDPSSSTTRWIRRFAELRPPYLHLYSVSSSEEIGIINLRNATVDAEPEVGRLLLSRDGSEPAPSNNWGDLDEMVRNGGPSSPGHPASGSVSGGVFAIYGTGMSWIFKARSELAKGEWILAIDRGFMGATNGDSGSGSGSGSGWRSG